MSVASKYLKWQATAAVAMAAGNATFTPESAVIVTEIRLHLSAVGGAVEDFVCTLDDHTNAVYDAVLMTTPMAAAADVTADNLNWHLRLGDDLIFTYANTNTRTWGLTVVYRET